MPTPSTVKMKECLNCVSTNISSDKKSVAVLLELCIWQQINMRPNMYGTKVTLFQHIQWLKLPQAVKEFSKSRLRRRAQSNLLRRPKRGGMGPMVGNNLAAPRHPNSVSPVADRSQSPSATGDNPFDLIREEIAVMKKLHHPNLVSLIEVLDDPEEDSLFMVLEMCKKGVIMKVEVDDVVDPYGENECRTWFRDLILGIEYRR